VRALWNAPSAGARDRGRRRALIRGTGGGIIGTGESVDFDKETIATPDGIEVAARGPAQD
jgi:hypothetical protein